MTYVQYAERPDICALTTLPDGQVRIDLRENIVSTIVGDDTCMRTVWSAEEYSLVRHPRHGLEQDVRHNFATYIEEAKAEAEVASLEVECASYEREMTKNLAGTLLELDFRLMMIEANIDI